eukprot:7633905-Karenia_brevis.AAC.1
MSVSALEFEPEVMEFDMDDPVLDINLIVKEVLDINHIEAEVLDWDIDEVYGADRSLKGSHETLYCPTIGCSS